MPQQLRTDRLPVMALYKVTFVAALLILLTAESHSQLSVCGQAELNTRIVGGQAAPEGSWPWQVSLHTSRHFCGGSLINNEWVLTAAHCVDSSRRVTVFLGRQRQEGSNPNEISREVSQTMVHPDYDRSTLDNDIALLKLSTPVDFSNFIMPVCLAASGSTFFNGTDSWVTGWGSVGTNDPLPSPQNLMEVEVPVVGNRQCNCLYGSGRITENMICAGLLAGGKDSCQGDSGGPMVSKQNNLWVQSGIVSFGIGCAQPNFPGVYTRVSQYQAWINGIITTNQPGFVTFSSTGTDGDLSISCPGVPPVTALAPTASPGVCGQAPLNSRIVGGISVTSPGIWPWMASLQKNGSHVCGGTLVATDAVISDADCFSSSPNASEWTVILGRLNQTGSNAFEKTLNVSNITLSSQNGTNIAVLHLESEPTLSDSIQPICLDTGLNFSLGSTCWAAGWGSNAVLQELQTSLVDCGNASTADSICTGVFTLDQGDSGGPLMCRQGASWFQVSVLSVGNSSGIQTREGEVMVFTKLSQFQSFLSQTLGTFLSPASNSSSTNSTNSTSSTTPAPSNSGGSRTQSALPLLFLHFLLFGSLHLFS